MAFIKPEQQFNPDALHNLVIGIAADMGKHDSGMHHHHKAQLLYASAGCMRFSLADTQVVLPPTRAAWLPAGVEHHVTMRNVVAYRSLYFEPEAVASLPSEVTIFHVNPLLKALIDTMSYWPWNKPRYSQHNAFALFCEELENAKAENLALPLPQDKRLQTWLKQVLQQEMQPANLKEMAIEIGASERTISRIFSSQTGMAYQAWRQQWRLLSAIEQLAAGTSVAQAGFNLQFSSDSAFISFFKQYTGTTPAQYFK
ncbi:helix-turn-helix transcriptional regulator [Shewanella oneidensis MR-1]|uniref:Transcriptional regulator AraC family n=1 Tax=Shewanella oneidensis (strain ATCC 700550 / JCM 31522 / CIP 106686 / LMG 19005 / NCIMB 14063 / MR-1) TaxID=211586 RepID=Q8EBM3_SHEON|nr:helix-turn-helix transcriptional regulator [Shewanella oneidensis]AAN56481.1 transcriptional regulator AraC family [Shewanella oneidensis MR-1]MDX5999113.1 helix-turn-helix transcriptional regulator [Shewanella oneidensis]MEE2029421.1 HTH-type transcriptional regulator NimR [Shewanella oneidensis]QKG97866.1 helix-turn-helix transcriptional regulator [Shewanella oneidensis MR-1]